MGIGVAGWILKYICVITKPHQRYKSAPRPEGHMKLILPAVWIFWRFINHHSKAGTDHRKWNLNDSMTVGLVSFPVLSTCPFSRWYPIKQPTHKLPDRTFFFCTWNVAMIGKWSDDGRPLNKLVSTSKSINFKEPLQSIQSICPWIIPWRVIGHFACKVTDGL